MTKAKRNWTILNIIIFTVIGLMNTVFLKPEDVGTWKNYVGYGFLLIAIIELIYYLLILKRRKIE
jgi:hypothetical protein